MKKTLLLLTVLCIGFSSLQAQELKCNVIVNSDQIGGTNKMVFVSMQKAISEFINNRRWSELQYAQHEKIECSFVITINTQSDNSFKATLQIQSRRPVYNSVYYTTLFNFKDDNFNFDYLEMTQLEFTEGIYSNNLTAVLAYYCYLIVGYDCDSFSKMGGTASFLKAEAIVNSAQSQSEKGWKAFESNRNRYALINNLLDDNLKKFRELFYDYHRLGLDEMYNDVGKGSAKIASSIQALKEVNSIRPSCVVVTSFLETKADEIVNIFSKAPAEEKTSVYELLMDIDPSQSAKYDPIINNK
jgi:hypothetical protein